MDLWTEPFRAYSLENSIDRLKEFNETVQALVEVSEPGEESERNSQEVRFGLFVVRVCVQKCGQVRWLSVSGFLGLLHP